VKDKEVVITDRKIILKENERSVVMHKGSKELTEMYALIVCQNAGDVIDIGFGMGFSANEMHKRSDSYTCIEINPQIYKKATEWAKDKPNVNIIFGDWYEIIPQLGLKYDGIFMDTHYDFNYNEFEKYAKLIAKDDCILSIWNYHKMRDTSTLNERWYSLEEADFDLPTENTHYIHWTVYNENTNTFDKTSNNIKSKQEYII
jgi:spermidine synthase